MPQVVAEVTVLVEPSSAFAVSQTTGAVRFQWDPFIREQHLMDGATTPAKGVRTSTRSRHGFAMVSEYVSYQPQRNVGMTMRSKPWFFASSAVAGACPQPPGAARVRCGKYTFTCRPSWLRRIAEPLGARILGRDIERRIRVAARASGGPAPT